MTRIGKHSAMAYIAYASVLPSRDAANQAAYASGARTALATAIPRALPVQYFNQLGLPQLAFRQGSTNEPPWYA